MRQDEELQLEVELAAMEAEGPPRDFERYMTRSRRGRAGIGEAAHREGAGVIERLGDDGGVLQLRKTSAVLVCSGRTSSRKMLRCIPSRSSG